jgi:antimicrobial peptide system SdpB family protein
MHRITTRLREPLLVPDPHTPLLGLARTLIALGTAGTLAFTRSSSLFTPAAGVPAAPYCTGIGRASVFCLVPRQHLGLAQMLCAIVLLITASGIFPRWTAVPHWFVSFSVFNSITIADGGDQIACLLTFLLLPVLITDRRRWHWSRSPNAPERPRSYAVAAVMLSVIQIQIAGVYFQSSVAKLGVPEWADGSAMYYWFNETSFGAPLWLRPALQPLVDNPVGVAVLTWSPLFIEFALFLSILLPRRFSPPILVSGLLLHFFIGLTMGLWSFVFCMWGAILLLTRPEHLMDRSISKIQGALGRSRSTQSLFNIGSRLTVADPD